MRRESYQIDESRNAFGKLARGNAAEAPVQVQKFGGREPFVKAKIFRQEPDSSADGHVARRRVQHKGFSAGRPGETQKHFDRSAFARSVWPEESKYFASSHGQGQVAHRDFSPEDFAQILCPDREAIQLGQCQLLFISDWVTTQGQAV